MVSISTEEIKKDVEGFLHQVEAGETMIVTEQGKPLAEIKPVSPAKKQKRPFGLAKDEFIVPDNFDAPLPEGILAEFDGQ